ncbi:sensor histidine kinase [Jannaschia sp. KMU-145]|uniref:sensor histidine kinase n=1 Tax=Jannaschia halovivens TaxID=3388667 RepID=UPI00396AF7C7
MRDGNPTETAMLSAQLQIDTDWQSLAPAAGGIGRWVADLDSGLCVVDPTWRRLMDLPHLDAAFPMVDFFEFIMPEDRAHVGTAIEESRATGAAFAVEYRVVHPSGKVMWIDGAGRPMTTADGRKLLIGVNHDVTAFRQAQERAELMAGEMAHRIKNIFALVGGMFNMAARSSDTREALIESFQGRLRALSDVNSLTFSGNRLLVRLRALVDTTLGALVEAGQIDVELTNDFALNGTAAQTVVLSLNELLTNAVKHGALSDPKGRVALSILVSDGDFVLTWRETAPHEITPPAKLTGFGMRVLRSMTVATFDGVPEFDWAPTGLTFRCTWKAAEMSYTEGNRYADQVVEQAVRATESRGS